MKRVLVFNKKTINGKAFGSVEREAVETIFDLNDFIACTLNLDVYK